MAKVYTILVPQATAVAGYNVIGDEKWKTQPYTRKLVAAGLVGSTNPSDCSIEFYAGENRLAKIFNTTGGANKIPTRDDIQFIGAPIPKGVELQAKVVDAAVANDIAVMVKTDIVKTKSRRKSYSSYGRRYYRRRY